MTREPGPFMFVLGLAATTGLFVAASYQNVCWTIVFAALVLSLDIDTLKIRLGLFDRP